MSLDQASAEELERVRDLVGAALEAAGTPWQLGEKLQNHAVAQITVDYGHDSGRGVFVTWELGLADHEELLRISRESAGGDPRILASDDEQMAANERLREVLRRADIEAVDAENDFDPYLLRIVSAPGTD
ncbi:MAG TPA: hypothetical protein VHG10_07985 [Glycomyces sp.]|nr:hypothetical protein [Glycomyces sp.]